MASISEVSTLAPVKSLANSVNFVLKSVVEEADRPLTTTKARRFSRSRLGAGQKGDFGASEREYLYFLFILFCFSFAYVRFFY